MPVGDLYIRYEYWLAFWQLLLAMFGMGATLKPADFVAVVKIPKAIIVGLSAQIVLVPVLAYFFLQLFDLPPGVAVGLAIVAAIPGGTSSNIFTYFARGHVALSIAITAVTTIGCLVTVPFVLDLLIGPYVPADFELPAGQIAREILISLLIPLAAGMLLLKLAPKIAEPVSKWSVRISLLLIISIIVGALGAGRLDAEAMGLSNMLVIIGFIVLVMVTGFAVPKLLGLSVPDITAIDMEMTIRNVNLGVLIKASLFPVMAGVADPLGDLALFAILLYGGAMNFLVIPMILLARKKIPAA
jgi:BASS family bile acid:Na+ symporter